MGAWGLAAFEDDSALDWLAEPFEADGAAEVHVELTHVALFPTTDYLERDEGVEARAAAEIVAAAFDAPSPSIAEDILEQIAVHITDVRAMPDVRELAIKATQRLVADNSEINELWTEEDGNAAEWKNAISDLLKRLGV